MEIFAENSEIVKKYKKYLKSVFDYMVKNGYTCKPYPKVILDNTDQGNDIFMKTAYFDPKRRSIKIFVHDRAIKDCVRSFCHECIHYKQEMDGKLKKSGYTGDKITEDKKLIALEEEAYLKGNMAFRSWTELYEGKL